MTREIELVNAPITLYEAALIMELRKYRYGKLVVTMRGGNPIYVVIRKSKDIVSKKGLSLQGAIAIDPNLK